MNGARLAALARAALVLAAIPSIITAQSSQSNVEQARPTIKATGFNYAFTAIDRLAQEAMRSDGVGGMSIGLVVDGELEHQSAFGHADMEAGVPARPDHVYRIGSVTKQFTALALLKLAHEDKLRLSDPVVDYVPEIVTVQGYRELAIPISLVELATMTSGLSREPNNLPTYLVGPADDWLSVVHRALPEVRFEFEPDTRYQYSNIGYALVGAAVRNAAKTPYMDYVREEFLIPLRMRDSDFVPHDSFATRIATGYAAREGKIDRDTPAEEHSGRGYKVPNGALYSTVSDLAQFIQFQMSLGPESIIPRELLAENLSRVNSADGQLTSGYGLGFRVERRKELVIYGHGGSVAGYRAGSYFDPTRKLGVVVLRNVTGGELDITELAYQAMEILAEAHDGSRKRDASDQTRIPLLY